MLHGVTERSAAVAHGAADLRLITARRSDWSDGPNLT